MKKLNILLCGIGITCILTGCGNTMPELTEEENDVITEYAVNLLLKYDKNTSSRLVDLADYEEENDMDSENDSPEEDNDALEEETTPDEENGLPVADTEVVDISEEANASSIEEFYSINGFSFQYTGYELKKEYPDMTENEADAFFAMEATPGMQLLVLKFQTVNQSSYETELNMLNYGTRMRVSVNGESPKSVLSTMLLNDIQTYKETVEANGATELVAVVEVPEGTYVEDISLILKSDSDSTTISLQ